jgi:MYXO-CTERM domain-containing protein
MMQPTSLAAQGDLGLPQKSAPCGQTDTGYTPVPTGVMNTYYQGQKIPLTVQEVIYHPGHYRIAIAADQNSLPADPVVTPGATACGTAQIMTNPMLPIVADDVLDHMSPFSGPQTVQIQLPPNLTCTNCVMQTIEFMSDHGLNPQGGCFYHHCANISILPIPDGGIPPDSGQTTVSDGGKSMVIDSGMSPGGTTPTGCSCRLSPTTPPATPPLVALLALAALLLRRRLTRLWRRPPTA